ncbi:MAG: hypothetical protein ACYC8V_12090, partial [Caulobacteraceae bacterium]
MAALLAFLLLGACAAAVAASESASGPFGVLGVRFGGDAGETRIVLDLARPASATTLAGDEQTHRVVLAFASMAGAGQMSGRGHGLVRAWSLAAGEDGGRLSLDLSAAGQIRRRFLLPPADGVDHYRYVIDIDAAGARPTSPPPSERRIEASSNTETAAHPP